MNGHLNKPAKKLSSANVDEYIPFVYELARVAHLPQSAIAAKCGITLNVLRDYTVLIAALNEGHADHRLAIEGALFADAMMDPMAYEIEDRTAVRTARSSALRLLKNAIDKRDGFVPQQLEQERVRRLTDAELQDELKKFVGK